MSQKSADMLNVAFDGSFLNSRRIVFTNGLHYAVQDAELIWNPHRQTGIVTVQEESATCEEVDARSFSDKSYGNSSRSPYEMRATESAFIIQTGETNFNDPAEACA